MVNAQVLSDSIPEGKSSKYLEDQLYMGISYNMLLNKPSSIQSRGFSNTISLGFIRDIPFNKQRNFGIGVGLGYGRETHYHNMKIAMEEHEIFYGNFNDIDDFSNNIMSFHTVEAPFEIRWRTSTVSKYKFYRVYAGVKFAYILYSKAEYILSEPKKISNFDGVNKFQYGLNLSVGHGTWNFYGYYGLSKLFKEVNFNDNTETPLELRNIKLGLIFYLL